MDHARFDAMVQRLVSRGSRREVLAGVLSAVLLPASGGTLAKPRNGKGKRRGKGRTRRQRAQAEAVPASCYPGSPCTPGPGKRLVRCDFGGTNVLAGKNVQGSQLGSANLLNANAQGANFTDVQLGGACLVGANLTGATVSSGQLRTTVRCRTVLPNGTIDNTNCNSPTTCCPTCVETGQAGCSLGGQCCETVNCVATPDGKGQCGCLKDPDCPPGQVCCNNRCQACCTDAQCPQCQTCSGGTCVAAPNCGANAAQACCTHTNGGLPDSKGQCVNGDCICYASGTFIEEGCVFEGLKKCCSLCMLCQSKTCC